MKKAYAQIIACSRPLRWVVWSLYVMAWTVALETTQPVRLGQAVLPEPLLFPLAKCLHVASYAVLTVLTGWLQVPGRLRWLALGLLSCHAMGTEFFQQFVPGRHPAWMDVGFDHLGIAIGLALGWKWWRVPS